MRLVDAGAGAGVIKPVITIGEFGQSSGGLSRLGLDIRNNVLGKAGPGWAVPEITKQVDSNGYVSTDYTVQNVASSDGGGVGNWLIAAAIGAGILLVISFFRK